MMLCHDGVHFGFRVGSNNCEFQISGHFKIFKKLWQFSTGNLNVQSAKRNTGGGLQQKA